jgi:hypothetical protein
MEVVPEHLAHRDPGPAGDDLAHQLRIHEDRDEWGLPLQLPELVQVEGPELVPEGVRVGVLGVLGLTGFRRWPPGPPTRRRPPVARPPFVPGSVPSTRLSI